MENSNQIKKIISQDCFDAEDKEILKSNLLNQTFVLWLSLLEGYEILEYSESYRGKKLIYNFKYVMENFPNDKDFCFILGWMISLGFWHFGEDVEEKLGNKLLKKALNLDRKNSLFIWANDNNKLSSKEKTKLKLEFSTYYNFGEEIKCYFIETIR